jgi:toxin CptA
VALLAALICAGLMGLALQRGGTCTVAAVDELMSTGRGTRLFALVEASLWVAGGLLVARELGLTDVLGKLPAGRQPGAWGLVGAALLGVGAVVNGACVFGSVARLGSGDWAFAATPLGFYAGCALASQPLAPMAAQAVTAPAPLLGAPVWLAWLLLALGAARLVQGLHATRASPRAIWSPHAATTLIALSFLGLLLLAGTWAYTDVLADLARHMAGSLSMRLALLSALLAGALLGGWLAGLWRARWPTARALLRCLAGGLLMGCGSLLIPGGHDGLLLVAMPLLWPYAWAAFAAMGVAVACSLAVTRRAARPGGSAG